MMNQSDARFKHSQHLQIEFQIIAKSCDYKLKDGVYYMDCGGKDKVPVDIDAPPAFKG